MVRQSFWIAITVGTFFAGLGIGIMTLQPVSSPMITGNPMQISMHDPQSMEKWHQAMMNDPEVLNQWMHVMMQDRKAMEQFHQMMAKDPNHMRLMMSSSDMKSWMLSSEHSEQMTEMMKENHDYMQGIMVEMINDPEMRLQMFGHMSENQEAMNQMRMMVNGTNLPGDHMDHNIMNP